MTLFISPCNTHARMSRGRAHDLAWVFLSPCSSRSSSSTKTPGAGAEVRHLSQRRSPALLPRCCSPLAGCLDRLASAGLTQAVGSGTHRRFSKGRKPMSVSCARAPWREEGALLTTWVATDSLQTRATASFTEEVARRPNTKAARVTSRTAASTLAPSSAPIRPAPWRS